MSRTLKVAAAQLGPVHLTSPRPQTLQRMIALLEVAASQGCQLVLFPELAFVTFFPRHLIPSAPSPSFPYPLSSFFEHEDDISRAPDTAALFEKSRLLGVDISVGYAERASDGRGFNTSVYYSAREGRVLQKYRKVHLPGTVEPFDNPAAVNQLEKRYFTPGDLGFPAFRVPHLVAGAMKKGAESRDEDGKEHGQEEEGEAQGRRESDGRGDPILGMLICNDRRWPEAWRCYGLSGAELILCGYNTVSYAPELWGDTPTSPSPSPLSAGPLPTASERTAAYNLALTQHQLSMQSQSYMNSSFAICAAKSGLEDGTHELIAGSCIVSPEGKILAEAQGRGDELVSAEIDLAECRRGKGSIFDFERHRRVEAYGVIVGRTGVVEPGLL